MLKSLRAAGVTLALLVASLAGTAPATAATQDPTADDTVVTHETSGGSNGTGWACLDQESGYQTTAVCELVVLYMTPVCRNDVPWLDYKVDPKGTPNTTVSITFGDPNGDHFTYSDLPREGSILWPGAVVDANGTAVDWPGWRLDSNGNWVEGDEFKWARPDVTVHFKVNPEAERVATYPPATPGCSANPPGHTDPPTTVVLAANDLAATGASGTSQLIMVAAGGLLVGSLFLVLRAALRRRQATAR